MAGPVLAIYATLADPIFFLSVLIWIVASRLMLCAVLFTCARSRI